MQQLNIDSGEEECHCYNCTCGRAVAFIKVRDTSSKLLCSSSTGRNLPERKSQLWRKLWRNASDCNSPSTLMSKVTLMRCCQQTTNCYVKYIQGQRLQIAFMFFYFYKGKIFREISILMMYSCAVVEFPEQYTSTDWAYHYDQ